MKTWKEGVAGGLIAAVIVLGGPYLLQQINEYVHPPEKWLQLRSFRVEDTEIGVTPITYIDRTVRETILGDWVVTLWFRNADGTFTSVCRRNFERELIPEARLPSPTYLSYWLGSPPEADCSYSLLGTYKVTLWVNITTVDGKPVAPIVLESNEFRICPPGQCRRRTAELVQEPLLGDEP